MDRAGGKTAARSPPFRKANEQGCFSMTSVMSRLEIYEFAETNRITFNTAFQQLAPGACSSAIVYRRLTGFRDDRGEFQIFVYLSP